MIARRLGPTLRRIVDAERPTVRERCLRAVLAGASVGYGWLVSCRNAGYTGGVFRVHRLPCRVISVGNLTVGGTGKTPTVMALARCLTATHARPGVLIRGYGGTASDVGVVSSGADASDEWRAVGDEAVLLAHALPGVPVIVGANRVAAGRFAIERFGADVLVLDDGFQHRRIFRDADLVLVDATDPFGGGRLLPRGRLREPVSGLRRAHAVLMTRADQVPEPERIRERIEALAPGRPIGMAEFRPCALRTLGGHTHESVEAVRGKRVLAVSGIANPEAFHRTLVTLGAEMRDRLVFPDHHAFDPGDCRRIGESAAATGTEWIVTTEKDAVRLPRGWDPGIPVLSVEIALRITEGAEQLAAALGISLESARHG